VDYIENRTFDEIQIGDSASLVRTLTRKDIQLFAIMSGDISPTHLDEEYAKSSMFQGIIAHGMWGGALISALLGTVLPGPGTIYLGQTLRFKRPVVPGDKLTVSAIAIAKVPEKHRIIFDCECVNQKGEVVIKGEAEILVVPDMEVGTMLVKQLEYLAEGQSADVILGTRVPIALTDRTDTVLARLASCAAVLLLARKQSI